MRYLLLFFLIGCSFHSTRRDQEFEKLLEVAREQWRNKEDQVKVETTFKEVLTIARAYNDQDKKVWAFHEWGRYLLAISRPQMAREKFLLSLAHNEHLQDPMANYLNSFNLAYILRESKQVLESCSYLILTYKAMRKIEEEDLYDDHRKELRSRLNVFSDQINCQNSII